MAGTGIGRTYSIKEVAALVGLPPSTLRYYEDVSVIPAIARDPSSGHRIYTEGDLGRMPVGVRNVDRGHA